MSFHKALIGIAIALAAAAKANADEPTPAWQEPGYVMDEIVVTLSREEQAVIRAASFEEKDAFELAATPAGEPTRL